MIMTLKPKVFKKGGKQRYGKGFSREELKKAGISLREALKAGIPVDFRRKTIHTENVEAVKAFIEKEKPKPKKSKGKSKS
ncbi:MAG: ribosomal protein L13e [Candidatus Bathyarchaeota archaeon]|jgi:large subunit ribosomal protein L13e|nr:ribosomal protein L13e [Candidatus Bathyarchaeota archaeon]